MEKLIQEMLEKKTWAVVGATNTVSKYGNRIYKALKRNGYDVFPVNPVYDEVEGVKCYSTLSEIGDDVDCVNLVVPPERGMAYIKEAVELGIKYLWFQPGTFDEALLDFAEENGLNIVYYNCILVELANR